MSDQTEKDNVENRDVHKVRRQFLIPLMLSVLVNSINHCWEESFENILRQIVRYVFGELVVPKIFA